jgi:hypothetical protein
MCTLMLECLPSLGFVTFDWLLSRALCICFRIMFPPPPPAYPAPGFQSGASVGAVPPFVNPPAGGWPAQPLGAQPPGPHSGAPTAGWGTLPPGTVFPPPPQAPLSFWGIPAPVQHSAIAPPDQAMPPAQGQWQWRPDQSAPPGRWAPGDKPPPGQWHTSQPPVVAPAATASERKSRSRGRSRHRRRRDPAGIDPSSMDKSAFADSILESLNYVDVESSPAFGPKFLVMYVLWSGERPQMWLLMLRHFLKMNVHHCELV